MMRGFYDVLVRVKGLNFAAWPKRSNVGGS